VGIRVYKPTTNGRRNMTSLDFAEITTSTPEKSLLVALKSKAGRNNNGRITVRHQGGGHKRFYRLVDFKRNKDNVEAVVKTIEYDPNRSANIALVHYTDGVKAYIIAPKGLEVGQRIVSGPEADIKVGNALPLANIPVGTLIHNIELKPGRGGELVRAAGASAQVLGQEGKYVLVRLQSGEVRMILGNDHPHGGGEGKAPVGRKAPSTPWGKPALGLKTRNKKAKSDKLIVRRRNEK